MPQPPSAATPAAPATPPAAPAAGQPPATGTPPNPSPAVAKSTPEPEFHPLEVVVDGRRIVIETREQLNRALQKSIFADQEIKNAAQAKRGAEALISKIKTKEGLREVLTDPEIGHDIKQLAIEWVKEAMDDEKLTPADREARKTKQELEALRKEKEERTLKEKQDSERKDVETQATAFRTEIMEAMKSSDMPQDQMTMDACIQMMRAGYRKHGKVLPAAKAMELVQKQYWDRLGRMIQSWDADKIHARLGEKVLDKIQKLELSKLREKLRGGGTPPAQTPAAPAGKKKDHLTEKEWLERAAQREKTVSLGGL